MALPAVQADWRGCPQTGNECIKTLLNSVVNVEAEIPILHGEEPNHQVMAKVHSEARPFDTVMADLKELEGRANR
jgi:hypothetical protein